MTVVLLATMLSVFAVPASAEDSPKEIEVSGNTIIVTENCIINKAGEYTVCTVLVSDGKTLTIGEGVSIKVTKGFDCQGKIELLGTLDLSQVSVATGIDNINVGDATNFDSELKVKTDSENGMEGEAVTVESKLVVPPVDTGYKVVYSLDKVEKTNSKPASILSEGNIWIIAVCAVALGGVALIIVKKKKKPALAGGENKDEE